ncbi:hypothetical protein [Bradyrhizobium viridifuturi]|uniref:hypothetical protein n=1 Tax=Bradyrhizobium viridifuturi TaxID=1654716 RepID=UPI00067F0F40|nr:hypothetical protein [Bradyrhizobium viridifuturi]
MTKSKKPRKGIPRGPNQPKPITEVRQLVSRKEAAVILGCHPDTVKKMEKGRGGQLDVIRLHPKGRTVFYKLADLKSYGGVSTATVETSTS